MCGVVRTPVRKRYRGYELARQQLQLCADGLNARPWGPDVHRLYPAGFREAARFLLLCATREPLCRLPECVLLLTIEHYAWSFFWEAPDFDYDEGEDFHCRLQRGGAASSSGEWRGRIGSATREDGSNQPGSSADGGGGASSEGQHAAATSHGQGPQPALKFVDRLNRFVPARQSRARQHPPARWMGACELL